MVIYLFLLFMTVLDSTDGQKFWSTESNFQLSVSNEIKILVLYAEQSSDLNWNHSFLHSLLRFRSRIIYFET